MKYQIFPAVAKYEIQNILQWPNIKYKIFSAVAKYEIPNIPGSGQK